jgi:hypothetical protein
MYRSGALRNLIEVIPEYCTDLLAIQEIEWLGKSMLEEKNCMVYYSCHEKQHCSETGFIVSTNLTTQVTNFRTTDTKIAALSVYMHQNKTKIKWQRVSFMSN